MTAPNQDLTETGIKFDAESAAPLSAKSLRAAYRCLPRGTLDRESWQILDRISDAFVLPPGKRRVLHIDSGVTMSREGFAQFCAAHFGDLTLTTGDTTKVILAGPYWWLLQAGEQPSQERRS